MNYVNDVWSTMTEDDRLTLSANQLAEFAKLTAPTADPILTYVHEGTLVPIDIDNVAPGQCFPALAVRQSGAVEPILVAGRAVAEDKPGEYWWKLMLSDLLDLLEDMSGKQTKALREILDMFDPNTGIVLATQEELAKRCGVSDKTMRTVLKLMIKHKLIAMRSPGVYVINPSFMSQGGGRRYNKLLIQYCAATKKNLPYETKDPSKN